jgi:hypothetical protein
MNPKTRIFTMTAIISMLAACTGIGEIAYDEAANRERRECERFVAMSDRQACLQRVNTATKQAEASRKKP